MYDAAPPSTYDVLAFAFERVVFASIFSLIAPPAYLTFETTAEPTIDAFSVTPVSSNLPFTAVPAAAPPA